MTSMIFTPPGLVALAPAPVAAERAIGFDGEGGHIAGLHVGRKEKAPVRRDTQTTRIHSAGIESLAQREGACLIDV